MMMSEFETGKMKDVSQPPAPFLTFCTNTGKRVTSEQWQQISVGKEEAIWWKCPECHGWHITFMRRDTPYDSTNI